MIVWPVNSSRTIVANRRPALTRDRPVRGRRSAASGRSGRRGATSWNRKQPSPGPRSASRRALVLDGAGIDRPRGRPGGRAWGGRGIGCGLGRRARFGHERQRYGRHATSAVAALLPSDDGPRLTLRPPVRGVAVRLAPGARADRGRRRGGLPAGARRARASRLGDGACVPLRRGGPALIRVPDGLRRAARRTFFGTDTSDARIGPGPAPIEPTPSADLMAEFTTRLAPHNLNSWHPRSLSYFTPPPLTMSIVGELLTQFTNQGVDVWHAGPIAAFVEEEVGALAVRPRRLRTRTASGS